MLDRDDQNLIVALAGCSLATSPGDKDNWVERSGSGGRGGKLPNYICRIARAVMRSGKSKSSAIAIAVSRVKKWAAGADDVNADTRAKAAKAVAQWEAMKAKNKAKRLVKATNPAGESYLMLCNIGSFNTKIVGQAWRAMFEKKAEEAGLDRIYSYITELYTDHIIVSVEVRGDLEKMLRVPYEVTDGEVFFGDPTEVKLEYVEVDELLTDSELALLQDVLQLSNHSPLEAIRSLYTQ